MRVYCTVALLMFPALLSTVYSDVAIAPADYVRFMETGFATNWFKTNNSMAKYKAKNIDDVYAKGFRNLRLRCRADLYDPPYNNTKFKSFLKNLTIVVDKCIATGVTPIISWIHHHDEAYATETAKKNYVTWWKKVAKHLKDKSYKLCFNLFTELGVDACGGDRSKCGESLRENTDRYNLWTKAVVKAIRNTGGNNEKRILILGSPEKTGEDLDKIDEEIYKNDSYMMAEWHLYASGPNQEVLSNGKKSAKYWKGDGTKEGRKQVNEAIKHATDFTDSHGLKTYLGAWMPTDNKDGSLSQSEVIEFGKYFAKKLKEAGIPWSLNVLDRYYDTKKQDWIEGKQEIQGKNIDMALVLKKIEAVM